MSENKTVSLGQSIKDCVQALHAGKSITPEQAHGAVSDIMSGAASDALIGAFLSSWTLDKCTPEAVAACARAMREKSRSCDLGDVVDIVGTGGDGLHTFNASTAAAFVVAAAGGRIAKHGNRASSSKCGSADLVEAMGARLDVDGEQARRVMTQAGFCFLFAQRFHPSMRFVAKARKELGIRTVFNIMGPLINPARPRFILTGVFSKQLGPMYAETLRCLGVQRAMVVHSAEGLDEISVAGPTHVWMLDDGKIEEQTITPESVGLKCFPLEQVQGGGPAENHALFDRLVAGEDPDGAIHAFVAINAGAALYVAKLAPSIKEGVAQARELIRAGKVRTTVDNYVRASHVVFERPANPPVTLMIDNYDSFTHNIAQYLSELGANVHVVRNDKITVEECIKLNPVNVVISPGPGYPSGAGVSMDVIRAFQGKVPVLGVCLGHQSIYELYGGKIVRAGEIRHGKTSPITHDGKGVFLTLPQEFQATRYHSLVGDPATLPACLAVTAKVSGAELIMGVRHREFTVEGVQFHPESIITEGGKTLIANFLDIKGGRWPEPQTASL